MADSKEGVVKWFSDKKGYGFITTEGEADIFVHYSGVVGSGFRSLKEGAKVSYEVAPGKKGVQAINVRLL